MSEKRNLNIYFWTLAYAASIFCVVYALIEANFSFKIFKDTDSLKSLFCLILSTIFAGIAVQLSAGPKVNKQDLFVYFSTSLLKYIPTSILHYKKQSNIYGQGTFRKGLNNVGVDLILVLIGALAIADISIQLTFFLLSIMLQLTFFNRWLGLIFLAMITGTFLSLSLIFLLEGEGFQIDLRNIKIVFFALVMGRLFGGVFFFLPAGLFVREFTTLFLLAKYYPEVNQVALIGSLSILRALSIVSDIILVMVSRIRLKYNCQA